jgi:glycosyltransferase involved in cell wall biosynthesis
MTAQAPLASVIVPTRNAGDDLARLLGALERQTMPRSQFEVLIADDGSTDGSTDGIETETSNVRVIPGAPVHSYHARNRAAREARGAVLAFTDADCQPRPDWLERGLAALEEADAVAGEVRFFFRQRRRVWSLLDIDSFLDQERAVRNGRAVGANLFVRRDRFEGVGGFSESAASGGDYELVSRLRSGGADLAYSPAAIVEHPTRDGAREYLGKTWRVYRWSAYRRAQSGSAPWPGWRSWVPIVRVARVRRGFGRSLRLDRHRLRVHGIRPSLVEDAAGLVLIYLVVPYLANIAQVYGAAVGSRDR